MTKFEKFILNRRLSKSIIRWSKGIVLPGCKGFSLYEVTCAFIEDYKNAHITDMAGSISFFFLLAIPPTCIFLFTLLPYVPLDNVENTIYLLVRDITPNENTYVLVHGIIHDFLHTQRTGLLSFSFLLAIFYSSSAVTGILRTFNRDHPGFEKRNYFQQRWVAIKINSLLILLLVVSLIMMVGQTSIFTELMSELRVTSSTTRFFINTIRWVIILIMFFATLSLIYTYGPATEKRWKFITAGSTLATVLMILSTLGFSYYVNSFSRYNQIYGSIGSLIVLMLWIFINSYVLLIGFEVNTSIEILEQREKRLNL